MRKTFALANGNEIDLYLTHTNWKYSLTEVVLRRGTTTLGCLVRDEHGNYVAPNCFAWFKSKADEDAAAAYYAAKYPDLKVYTRSMLFIEGFAREDLGDVVERGCELAEAINQEGEELFLGIDAEGRVVAYGNYAHDVIDDAQYMGWKGWFSPTRADEQTLRIVPASKVRMDVKD
jgi:hypothetical protein